MNSLEQQFSVVRGASIKRLHLKFLAFALGLLAASIVAMVPCFSPCCLLGLPFGIWALVVLTKPEVKGAFQ